MLQPLSPRTIEATAAALAAVETNWSAQVAHLQTLVREPSVLGREVGIQRVMMGSMRQLGLDVHQVAVDVDTLRKVATSTASTNMWNCRVYWKQQRL